MNQEKFSFSKHFVSGEFHLGFWSFVKKGVGFFDSVLILSSLSLYQYGVYTLILSIYAIISDFFHNIFGAVVGNDLVRFVGEGRFDKARKLFIEFTVFRIVMALIPAATVFIFIEDLSSRYGPEAILWMVMLASLFVVDAVSLMVQSLLKTDLKYKVLATRPTIQKLVQFLVLAYFFFTGSLHLTEIFLAQLVAPIAVILLLIPSAMHSWRKISGQGTFVEPIFLSIIKSYGFWELPQTIFKNISGNIRPILIKMFLNTEAVGIFSVANTAISLLKDVIPTRTLSSLVPRKGHDENYLRYLFIYGTKYYLLLSFGLIIFGAALYPIAIVNLFPQFGSSIVLFMLMLPTVSLFAFTKLTNIFLLVKRRQRFVFLQMVFEGVLSVVLLFVTLPTIGILGLAISELIYIFSGIALKYVYLTKTKFIAKFPFRKLFSWGEEDRVIFRVLFSNLPIRGAKKVGKKIDENFSNVG